MIHHLTNFPVVHVVSNNQKTILPVVSVILPAYNEAAALPKVLFSLFRVIDAEYEVIVVDDGSSDNTTQLAANFPCRLLKHETNKGKGAAVRTGIQAAQGEFIIVMDADNTYPAQALPRMVEMLRKHDFVRCTRQMSSQSMPLINWVGNFVFDSTLSLIYGMKGGDYLTGLYGLRREAVEVLQFSSQGFDLEVELGIKAQAKGLRISTFPITYGERLGEKKLRPVADGWRILRRILKMALLYNPLLSFVMPGMVTLALTLVMLLALRANPFTGDISIHKLFLTMLGTSTGFQLVVFGICAALYGYYHGLPARRWFLQLARPAIRRSAIGLGLILLAGSSIELFRHVFSWLDLGNSSGIETYQLLQAGMFFFWGIQLVLAALFISIFADKVFEPANS